MNFILLRDEFRQNNQPTMGTLYLPYGKTLATIERPWNDNKGDIAGVPADDASCIYPGIYDLIPHTRPNGDEVVALVNPELDVYYLREDIPQEKIDTGRGRYLILIHIANEVDEIVGCIAPGLRRTTMNGHPAVASSTLGMEKFMEAVRETEEPHTLDIRQANAPSFEYDGGIYDEHG